MKKFYGITIHSERVKCEDKTLVLITAEYRDTLSSVEVEEAAFTSRTDIYPLIEEKLLNDLLGTLADKRGWDLSLPLKVAVGEALYGI